MSQKAQFKRQIHNELKKTSDILKVSYFSHRHSQELLLVRDAQMKGEKQLEATQHQSQKHFVIQCVQALQSQQVHLTTKTGGERERRILFKFLF